MNILQAKLLQKCIFLRNIKIGNTSVVLPPCEISKLYKTKLAGLGITRSDVKAADLIILTDRQRDDFYN